MSMHGPLHGGRGGGMDARSMYRSFRLDPSVAQRRLTRDVLRRILGFARPYRRLLTIFLVLVALDAAVGAATPLLYRRIIDDGISAGRTGLVLGLAGLVALLALVAAGLALASRWLSSRIGEGLILDLRTQVFDHVQRMPLAFFSRTQTGALVQRLNGDVLGAQQAFTSTLSNVVSNVLTVVLVIAAMLSLSWQITLVSLVLLPAFVLPARAMGRRLATVTQEAYGLNAEMGQTMTERFNVAGAQLVKLYGRPDDETAVFAGRAARVRDIGITSAMYGAVFRIGLTLVAAVAVAIVYGLGGVLAIQGSLTVGVVVALTSYLTRLYGPITALSNVQVDVMTTLVSFERVLEVLDLEPSVADAPDARPLPDDVARTATIELDDVSFRYPAASEVSLASLESVARLQTEIPGTTLEHVSFTVPHGHLVALVGPSGAGKTTISQVVARLYDVTGGAVRIAGQDVREVTQASLRDAIGIVTQDAHLFHDTIRANLLYAKPDATDAELEQALARAQIADLVHRLPDGVDTVVGDRGYRLSGGERQRLAIARLLLKAPPVVILDEATAHLDSESEAAVQRALAEALEGRTALVIAHRLSTIREADAIVVLDEGRVVQQGTHAELLAAGGLYAELYETQYAAAR
ncbi:ABC transporter ATP-binding protein/permease [Cellulomonas hominis]|uniref:ABC transporter ATP-binding protein n=1 Tax=Cellulomonas hominis TaxID=156981 RepID=UPI001C0FB473|nr:ABC transporter ATP-binding protein [Cellulomonas hominis]MBU5424078.1 ABC transporter ATP-binding protein/permease [Cellulomonas hominis]